MDEQFTIESLEAQLRSLYQEREQLESRLGCSSAEAIGVMVESLESQLRDFYDRYGQHGGYESVEAAALLSQLRELSSALDPLYSEKSVHCCIENGKPVLRAEWTEQNISQGAES